MDDMLKLLRPSWGAEHWIEEGWNQIDETDRALITSRVDALFKDGLPFGLELDRTLYIYVFSLLAQLEVLAIQVPLRFKDKMRSQIHQKQMHTQLLDEIFHGIVFTKILYLLSVPNAYPPDYSDKIEIVCNFIRGEQCPKTAVILLNLIGEGWIEEIFLSLKDAGIAPKVFEIILVDEHRHVCEAELYQDLGMPDQNIIRQKLEKLEDLMLTNVFLQYKYMYSICALLGEKNFKMLFTNLRKKHDVQLKKLNLKSSARWDGFTHLIEKILKKYGDAKNNEAIARSSNRNVLMTQWGEPSDPTMVGHFDLDISCLNLSSKLLPPETLTVLMLQAASKGLASENSFRNFLHHKKLYRSQDAHVSLVVQLPGCDEKISTIEFKNCHLLSAKELSFKIKQYVHIMTYCYKKRRKMEVEHPELKKEDDLFFEDIAFGTYPCPMPSAPGISVSNINSSGFLQGTSPLRKNEALKMTLFQVQKKPIWNDEKNAFEARDLLPVSISADHRVFDGNIPIPKLLTQSFEAMFHCLQYDTHKTLPRNMLRDRDLIRMINEYVNVDLALGYQMLLFLETNFFDYFNLDYFEKTFMNKISKKLSESL